MDAFQSMVLTFAIVLSVWLIADIVENLQDLNELPKDHQENQEVMNKLAKARFFSNGLFNRITHNFYH